MLTLLARAITELLSPYVVLIALPLLVAWQATDTIGAALLWGLLVALTSSLVPMAVIVYGARRGRWDGHHVRDRDGRLVPFLVALLSISVGLLLLVGFGAPWLMIVLDLVLIALLLIAIAVTLGWKLSIHAASVAGGASVLHWLYQPAWWVTGLLIVLVGLVCWSRVRLTDHTIAQVLAGVPLGALVVGGGFILLA